MFTTLWNLNRNSYELCRTALFPVTPNYPRLNHPIFILCTVLHVFVVGGDREFKFGRWVDRSKCQPMYRKLSLKGACSGHANHLNFGGHRPYLWNDWT